MDFLRSTISPHEFVLEPCQFGSTTVFGRGYKLFCAAVWTVIGISTMVYVAERHRSNALVSKRVIANFLNAIEVRLRVTQRRQPGEYRSASRVRQLPPTLTGSHTRCGMPAVEELSAKDAGPHPLLTFLQSQPKKALSRLYQRPSSCLCIFRFSLYSCSVKVESADAWGDCHLCSKIVRTTRKADCHEYSLVGCLYTCLDYVFLGRARGEKVSFLIRSLWRPVIECSCADLGPKYTRQYDQALIELSRIDVLVNSATELTLSATFKAGLRQAITGGYAKASRWRGSI
jgi:hypothetical protein